MQEQTLHNENNSCFYYCFDDAVETIFQNISSQVRFKYTWDDITLILELKDEYFDLCCQTIEENSICEFPVEINEEELRRFIMLHTLQNDLHLSEEDLIEILDAELVYFEKNGALRDAGEWLN